MYKRSHVLLVLWWAKKLILDPQVREAYNRFRREPSIENLLRLIAAIIAAGGPDLGPRTVNA